MKKYIMVILCLVVVWGCNDNEKGGQRIKIDSFGKLDSLNRDSKTEYNYPNLTKWGALKLKYLRGDLIVIESTYNAELGFVKNVYYLHNSKIYRIKCIAHIPDWDKYYEDYPLDKFEEISEKMTYKDSTIIFESNSKPNDENYHKLKQEGSKIIEFLRKENVNPPLGSD